MDIQALLLTIRLAITTTAILLVIALPLACWIIFSRARWKSLVEATVALPLVLPPTVLGFYLLIALGPTTALGRWITHLFGHPLAFSFNGLVIGSVIYSLPFAVQPLVAGFAAIPIDLLDAAAVLGANPLRIFLRVVLPLARASVLTAAVLSFTHTVGEFGVVLMLGGNIPGLTRTLSISLYDQVQDFQYAQTNHTAFALVLISFLSLVAIYARRHATRDDRGRLV
ncbi:MAG: molybdate ABC transporter permease subunit [Acidobacteriaceae bacterium]